MADIGILGSGRVATALANKLAGARYTLSVGVLGVAAAAAKWQGPEVSFGSHAETARAAPVIFNATPGHTTLDMLSSLREDLAGKILIDVSNATLRAENGMPGNLLYPNGSLAEQIQKALPETRIVKTLNTMLFTVMTNPSGLKVPPTVFVSGDDANAKGVAKDLLEDLGWRPEWIEDLGDIASARGPEAMALLVPSVIRAHGLAPFAFAIAR
ncbi:NAD(P)-binding domain-containing protein [Bradyrhizobium sp. OAE829]|uniref:NADPH-dependent F420 reductase n=1 Tax=Bradyrhizobium sp. OAE829 TaxID=2663807 RepID=UPI0017894629